MDSFGKDSDISIEGTLDEVSVSGEMRDKTIISYVARNMGSRTLLFYLPMKEFFDISIVSNSSNTKEQYITQRPLDTQHATKLAQYILKGLIESSIAVNKECSEPVMVAFESAREALGKQPYVSIQPLVCNIRNTDKGGSSLRVTKLTDNVTGELISYRINLPSEALLYVVDGQHRRFAMHKVLDFLKNALHNKKLTGQRNLNLLYPIKGELSSEMQTVLEFVNEAAYTHCTVQVEAHLGLSIEEERQLFHDLNNLGKKISHSLVLKFDSANPLNQYIKDRLVDSNDLITWKIIDKNKLDWNDHTGAITRKELTSINGWLFLKKSNINGATTAKIKNMQGQADSFWSSISKLNFIGEEGGKLKTVAAQPVFLKALAKLTHEYSNGEFDETEQVEILLEQIHNINLCHDNPVWRYFSMVPSERNRYGLGGLAAYFPEDIETRNKVKTFCVYDENQEIIRFGTYHNDVVPMIAEMVRFLVGFNPIVRKKPSKITPSNKKIELVS